MFPRRVPAREASRSSFAPTPDEVRPRTPLTAPKHALASVSGGHARRRREPPKPPSCSALLAARRLGGRPRDRTERAGADGALRDRRLELAAADRLGRGGRHGELLRVRQGDGVDDVHRPDLPAQPLRLDGAGDAFRRVPHGSSVRFVRFGGRGERDRPGRLLPLGRDTAQGRAPAGARRGVRRRPLRPTAHALGADLARPGRRTHGPQADRLRLAELLEDEAGRLAGRRGGRASTVDRPLDEGCAADPSGRELGWARLVVLAMEQLPEDRRDHRLRRRRPLQRIEPDRRRRAGVSRRCADERNRADDRRRPAGREAARRRSRDVGWRQAGDVRLSVAALRCSRSRLRRDRGRHRKDVHADRRGRRSRPARPRERRHAGGHGLRLVERDARGCGLRSHRRRGAQGAEAADRPGRQPGRAGADGAGRHVDGVAHLVLLPVAPLRDRCDLVRRDHRRGRRHATRPRPAISAR